MDTLLTIIMSYSLSTVRLSGPQKIKLEMIIMIQTETSPNSVVKIASFGCAAQTSKDTDLMPLCQNIISEEQLPLSSLVSPMQC